MRYFIFIFFCVFRFQNAEAQLTKVLHQTFEVDSVDKITINLFGEYKIEKWSGNNVLTETKIEIYDTTPGIFKYFIEEKGRYDIVAEISNMTASLFSNDSERRTIKNKETNKECYEFVKVKIFVPDEFNIDDPVNLFRRAAEVLSNE
jgi:hypothetical protein